MVLGNVTRPAELRKIYPPLLYYCEGPVAGNRPTVGSRDGIFLGG